MIKFGRSIPILIHPIFWLTAAIIGFINSFNFLGTLIWIGVILVSLLVHEYGHALTAKLFGQEAQIQLVALGGMTYHDGKKLKRWQDFVIVLMGPVFGLALAGVAYLIRGALGAAPQLIFYTLTLFFVVNVFWTIVNLLPIMPLDGGQLLRIVLEGIFGHRGLKIAVMTGVVLAVGIGIVAFVMGLFLVGAILLLLAFEGFATWNQVKNMTSQDQNQDMHKLLEEAQSYLQQGNFEEAKKKLEALRAQSKKGLLYDTATEQLAFISEKEGHIDQAYHLLKDMPKNLSITGKCLLHRAAFYSKDYDLTLHIGNLCFQETQIYEIAFINAMASACKNDVRSSIGWLECSIKHGLPNIKEAVAKPEFDSIRSDTSFQAFLNSH